MNEKELKENVEMYLHRKISWGLILGLIMGYIAGLITAILLR